MRRGNLQLIREKSPGAPASLSRRNSARHFKRDRNAKFASSSPPAPASQSVSNASHMKIAQKPRGTARFRRYERVSVCGIWQWRRHSCLLSQRALFGVSFLMCALCPFGWQMGIRDHPISPRSPWQNPYVERLIGTIRRDCLDHVLIFGERHLRRVLTLYSLYYNETRTHLGLELRRPFDRRRHWCRHGTGFPRPAALTADLLQHHLRRSLPAEAAGSPPTTVRTAGRGGLRAIPHAAVVSALLDQ